MAWGTGGGHGELEEGYRGLEEGMGNWRRAWGTGGELKVGHIR